MPEQKTSAYENFLKAFANYREAGERMQEASIIPRARQASAQYVLDGGGTQLDANILMNEHTPIETNIEAIEKFGVKPARRKLDELVKNSFDQILGDLPEGVLETLLAQYEPKFEKGFEEFAQLHKVYRNADLEDKDTDKIRADEIKAYYEKTYADKKDLTDEEKKEQKDFLVNKLYGSPETRTLKYREIHEPELKKFQEKIKDKKFLADYIKLSIPEDTEERIKFLVSMVELQKQLAQRKRK
jgi:hypothetical protein